MCYLVVEEPGSGTSNKNSEVHSSVFTGGKEMFKQQKIFETLRIFKLRVVSYDTIAIAVW